MSRARVVAKSSCEQGRQALSRGGHEVIGEAEDVAVKLFQADRVLDEIARALA